MKKLNVSFSVNLEYSSLQTVSDLEIKYQSIYKNLANFFYHHSFAKISIFFPGALLSWIEHSHPEFIDIFSKLAARQQVEILGGGYYNPLLPTIFPMDRSGQVEYLTSEIRSNFVKHPRGVVLLDSVWENTLVPSLQNVGMEYVLLDKSLMKDNSEFVPYILTEKGKSIKVILQNNEYIPDSYVSPKDFLSILVKIADKDDDFEEDKSEKIVSIKIDEKTFSDLYHNQWFEQLYSIVDTDFADKICILNPLEYLKKCCEYIPAYIPSGIDSKYNVPTVFDYLYKSPRSKALYNRMLHISMLLSQCKGDKARKNSARENLWIAQTGEVYLYNKNCDKESFFNSKIRQYAYRNLSEAEKMIRESTNYKESLTMYDYNGDGHNEYICSMNYFTACISLKSAQIFEFDVMKSSGNYVDNENERGFFLSYLLNDEDFVNYKNPKLFDSVISNGVFGKKLFSEVKVNSARKEIKLLGMGEYSKDKLPVSIIKKYVANSNGFTVQFILKNESQSPVTGNLVVESNFAQMDFSLPECNSYKVEIVHNSDREKTTLSNGTEMNLPTNDSISFLDVSFVQITDTFNDISFVYEPNENCDIVVMPVFSKRGTTFVASLCWKVDLTGGLEIEKTVNFTVITPKKRK